MEHTDLNTDLGRYQKVAWLVGLAGAAAAGFGYVAHKDLFFHSYLMAFLYWFAIAGGSLALLLIHHLSGGQWGFVIQRPLEAAAKTIPLMALFFVPVALGLHDLYEWTHDSAKHDHILHQKLAYLNEPFFLGRAAFYFVVWTALAFALSAWSKAQDSAKDPLPFNHRLRVTAGPGLVAYVLTVSFAAIDWGMSLTPHWFSTMYAPLFMAGQGISTFAFMVLMANKFSLRKPYLHAITHQQFHDLGNMTFAFTILWTYMGVGEFIIIWSANIPEETSWFLDRAHGGWKEVAIILALCQFLIPFLLLLNKPLKRHGSLLARIALWILAFRYLGVFWMVAPTFRDQVAFHWVDLANWLAVGGLWLAVFLGLLRRHSDLPMGDPRLRACLAVHVADKRRWF